MARKTQVLLVDDIDGTDATDRKSTRLNSSHVAISYAVFCLKKKNRRDGHETVRGNMGEGTLHSILGFHLTMGGTSKGRGDCLAPREDSKRAHVSSRHHIEWY